MDIAAPGGDNSVDRNGDGYPDGVLSTGGTGAGASTGFAYTFLSGTSMAAPHVAGVLALMKSVNPALSVEDLEALLVRGDLSDDLGIPGRDDQYGEGLINSQRALLAAIEAPQDCVREMVKTYDERRRVVHKGLNAIDGIKCLKPESTFYAFPNISSFGLSSWEFAEYLVKEHKVAVVPGSIFGKAGEGHVRLSFAASIEQLKEGIARIQRGVEALKS